MSGNLIHSARHGENISLRGRDVEWKEELTGRRRFFPEFGSAACFEFFRLRRQGLSEIFDKCPDLRTPAVFLGKGLSQFRGAGCGERGECDLRQRIGRP